MMTLLIIIGVIGIGFFLAIIYALSSGNKSQKIIKDSNIAELPKDMFIL